MSIPALHSALADLSAQLAPAGIVPIIGGGFGLYLIQLDRQTTGVRTLFPPEAWTRPRATADLDIFLDIQVVASAKDMELIRQTLDSLGYLVVEKNQNWQFSNPLTEVVVDVLTGPTKGEPRIKTKGRRAGPKEGSAELHAHPTPEALGLERFARSLRVPGDQPAIRVPGAVTYLLMKLAAFRDRLEDPGRNDERQARQHALDLFRIVAMLTESEFEEAGQALSEWGTEPTLLDATGIVAKYFATATALGTIRLREHELGRDIEATYLDQFCSVLRELFPATG